jgi:hypothetical protein
LDDEGLGSMRTIDDLDELVTLADGASPVYLRYSKGPVADERAGPSIDYESGVRLLGGLSPLLDLNGGGTGRRSTG